MNALRVLKRVLRLLVALAAFAFLAQVLFAFVGLPGGLGAWITGRDLRSAETPRFIVVLGGGGIPSESGLIRTYYAAATGVRWTGVTYVVSLPSEGAPLTNSVGRMRDELILRGVRPEAILMEHRALNTHEQAVNIRGLLGDAAARERVLLVTSPTHVRRAYLCFRRAGFENVGVLAAANTGAEADPGGGVMLRYRFWSNIQTQTEVVRELLALLWYRLRGWI